MSDRGLLPVNLSKSPRYPKFVKWLRANADSKLRNSTLANYLLQLDTMVKHYALDLDAPDISDLINRMVKADLSPDSISIRLVILKKWLEYIGQPINEDTRKLLKRKRGQRKRKLHPKDVLTFEEVQDIVRHTRNAALKAFYMVLWDTAARPGAITEMTVLDVEQDLLGYVFTFRKTKNEQSMRTVRLLTPQANQFFEQWWTEHPVRDNPKARLFLNQRGMPYTPGAITSILKKNHQARLGRGTGKAKAALSGYLFRKSRATQLLKEGKFKEIEIKMRLGHTKDSQMLEKYYAILDEEDQADAELRYLGHTPEKEETPQPVLCPSCGAPNEAISPSCYRCRLPLTEAEATRQQQLVIRESLESLRNSGVLQELVSEAVRKSLAQRRRLKT